MKKFLFLFCLSLVASGATAQKAKGSFSLIPRVGASVANFTNNEIYYGLSTNDHSLKSKYNARFVGGMELEYQAFPLTSFSVGAFYSQQGCRFSEFEVKDARTASSTDQFREKFDYVQVPLLVNQYLASGFAVKAGVEFGFLTDAHISYRETGFKLKEDGSREREYTNKVNNDVKDMHNSFDISIPVGVSYEYMNVILDARYHFGLRGIYKDKTLPKEKNSFFTFTVGYRI